MIMMVKGDERCLFTSGECGACSSLASPQPYLHRRSWPKKICRMTLNLQALSANRVGEGVTSTPPGSETTGVVLTTRFATSDHEMHGTADFTTRFSPSNLSQSDVISLSDFASDE